MFPVEYWLLVSTGKKTSNRNHNNVSYYTLLKHLEDIIFRLLAFGSEYFFIMHALMPNIYTLLPQTNLWVVYRDHPVCLSICLYVRLFTSKSVSGPLLFTVKLDEDGDDLIVIHYIRDCRWGGICPVKICLVVTVVIVFENERGP